MSNRKQPTKTQTRNYLKAKKHPDANMTALDSIDLIAQAHKINPLELRRLLGLVKP